MWRETRRRHGPACACSCRPVWNWKDEAALLPPSSLSSPFCRIIFSSHFCNTHFANETNTQILQARRSNCSTNNATSADIIFGNISFLTMQQIRSVNKPYCCRFETQCSGNGRFCHSRAADGIPFPILAAVKSKSGSALSGACINDRLISGMGSLGPRCSLGGRGAAHRHQLGPSPGASNHRVLGANSTCLRDIQLLLALYDKLLPRTPACPRP